MEDFVKTFNRLILILAVSFLALILIDIYKNINTQYIVQVEDPMRGYTLIYKDIACLSQDCRIFTLKDGTKVSIPNNWSIKLTKTSYKDKEQGDK